VSTPAFFLSLVACLLQALKLFEMFAESSGSRITQNVIVNLHEDSEHDYDNIIIIFSNHLRLCLFPKRNLVREQIEKLKGQTSGTVICTYYRKLMVQIMA